MEPVHDHIRNLTWVIRGSIWTTVIFGIELITGLAIELTVGKVPWDYTGSSYYSIAGLIRLDYAPVWFVVGLLFEKVDDFMRTKIHL